MDQNIQDICNGLRFTANESKCKASGLIFAALTIERFGLTGDLTMDYNSIEGPNADILIDLARN
jgi:hypothetical protein